MRHVHQPEPGEVLWEVRRARINCLFIELKIETGLALSVKSLNLNQKLFNIKL